jgi:lysophospholipase L1-like esterase
MKIVLHINAVLIVTLLSFAPYADAQERQVREFMSVGHDLASAALESEYSRTERRALTGEAGLLVAEGDSWFDYPFNDILSLLEGDYNYDIRSVAHKGDTLESLVYDRQQLSGLTRQLRVLRDREKIPKAILLSGGGNDVAGDELAIMLNHRLSTLDPINSRIAEGVINDRLRPALISLLAAITEISRDFFDKPIPILIHGYDYPFPDGRGFWGGWGPLPGPWLEPAFIQKGYGPTDTYLQRNRDILSKLLDRYNTMLRDVATLGSFPHVHYIKVIGRVERQEDWSDEMHPAKSGFREIAAQFHDKISNL